MTCLPCSCSTERMGGPSTREDGSSSPRSSKPHHSPPCGPGRVNSPSWGSLASRALLVNGGLPESSELSFSVCSLQFLIALSEWTTSKVNSLQFPRHASWTLLNIYSTYIYVLIFICVYGKYKFSLWSEKIIRFKGVGGPGLSGAVSLITMDGR